MMIALDVDVKSGKCGQMCYYWEDNIFNRKTTKPENENDVSIHGFLRNVTLIEERSAALVMAVYCSFELVLLNFEKQ